MKPFAMFSILALMSATVALADDTVFAPAPQQLPSVVTVTAATIGDSPAVREHEGEVLAAADRKVDALAATGAISAEEKAQIKGWFKALPFQRIVDVELSFLSGLPDTVGICLEGNPSQYLTIDACASTMVFISSLSAHVASRFLHYISITGQRRADGSVSYSGHEFGFGPKVGARRMAIMGFDTYGTATGLDVQLSAEWVYWISRYFGMGLQLDAGATFVVQSTVSGGTEPAAIPDIRLSLGLSF